MVAHGYILPAKNIELRLKNLDIALKNNALALSNASLRNNALTEIKTSLQTTDTTDANAQVKEAIKRAYENIAMAKEDKASKIYNKIPLTSENASIGTPLGSQLSIDIPEFVGSPISSVSSIKSEPVDLALASAIKYAKDQASKENRILSESEIDDIKERLKKEKRVLLELASKPKINKEHKLMQAEDINVSVPTEVVNTLDNIIEQVVNVTKQNAKKVFSALVKKSKDMKALKKAIAEEASKTVGIRNETKQVLNYLINNAVDKAQAKELFNQILDEISNEVAQDVLDSISNISSTTAESGDATSSVQTEVETIAELFDYFTEQGLSKTAIDAYFTKKATADAKTFIVKSLKKGDAVYSAGNRSTKETFKRTPNNKLSLDKDGNIIRKDGSVVSDRVYKSIVYFNSVPTNLLPAAPLTASGLFENGSNLPSYRSYAPNFGNLYMAEKSLKKNNFIVYRPFTKDTVITKKNISPLLKKMILDIRDTLEFDKNDYNQLEGDEKRVIEKIIRSQKNMKEYNIEKLIDEDDKKIKKRLEILSGQVNAGNTSKYIKDEMLILLKQLYDNRAISYTKYKYSINAVKALGG